MLISIHIKTSERVPEFVSRRQSWSSVNNRLCARLLHRCSQEAEGFWLLMLEWNVDSITGFGLMYEQFCAVFTSFLFRSSSRLCLTAPSSSCSLSSFRFQVLSGPSWRGWLKTNAWWWVTEGVTLVGFSEKGQGSVKATEFDRASATCRREKRPTVREQETVCWLDGGRTQNRPREL